LPALFLFSAKRQQKGINPGVPPDGVLKPGLVKRSRAEHGRGFDKATIAARNDARSRTDASP